MFLGQEHMDPLQNATKLSYIRIYSLQDPYIHFTNKRCQQMIELQYRRF